MSGTTLNNGYSWSPNVESLYKYTSSELINAFRTSNLASSTILGRPLKLVADVKIQTFADHTMRLQMTHIQFYSNGSEISIADAHQILEDGRLNSAALGHTVHSFKKFLLLPFLAQTKRGLAKNLFVSQNEPAEVIGIKKLILSDLEMKGTEAQLQLVMKQPIITPLETPEMPIKISLGNGK